MSLEGRAPRCPSLKSISLTLTFRHLLEALLDSPEFSRVNRELIVKLKQDEQASERIEFELANVSVTEVGRG